ncbi:MAG: hypothetical protein KJP18_06915 [Gemmatimonadetes bacterium]|nr:hypothetical protein [Gemmatimonadota bacterium]NNF39155.1 hypothetical protein [Gemmatimonadota bacterium]NNK62490.1 hypothetical protein [Gemmatimonadota bacterium]
MNPFTNRQTDAWTRPRKGLRASAVDVGPFGAPEGARAGIGYGRVSAIPMGVLLKEGET